MNAENIDLTQPTLKIAVKSALTAYFSTLDGASPNNIYQLVVEEIERPLLEVVMQHAKDNQSVAAKWLGLSRNTLRKLLEKYSL